MHLMPAALIPAMGTRTGATHGRRSGHGAAHTVLGEDDYLLAVNVPLPAWAEARPRASKAPNWC
ncbi:MAG: hypothetical protein R3F17_05080 [Planctomycetota bacterium]